MENEVYARALVQRGLALMDRGQEAERAIVTRDPALEVETRARALGAANAATTMLMHERWAQVASLLDELEGHVLELERLARGEEVC